MTREIIEVTRGTQVVQDACVIMGVNVWGMGQIVSFGLVMEPLNPLPHWAGFKSPVKRGARTLP